MSYFFRESYVRFCSKPFTLDDFHESIHLSNNAVQCHYTNSDQRDPALPDENMWDCYTFQSFLKTQGKLDVSFARTIIVAYNWYSVGRLMCTNYIFGLLCSHMSAIY